MLPSLAAPSLSVRLWAYCRRLERRQLGASFAAWRLEAEHGRRCLAMVHQARQAAESALQAMRGEHAQELLELQELLERQRQVVLKRASEAVLERARERDASALAAKHAQAADRIQARSNAKEAELERQAVLMSALTSRLRARAIAMPCHRTHA